MAIEKRGYLPLVLKIWALLSSKFHVKLLTYANLTTSFELRVLLTYSSLWPKGEICTAALIFRKYLIASHLVPPSHKRWVPLCKCYKKERKTQWGWEFEPISPLFSFFSRLGLETGRSKYILDTKVQFLTLFDENIQMN